MSIDFQKQKDNMKRITIGENDAWWPDTVWTCNLDGYCYVKYNRQNIIKYDPVNIY